MINIKKNSGLGRITQDKINYSFLEIKQNIQEVFELIKTYLAPNVTLKGNQVFYEEKAPINKGYVKSSELVYSLIDGILFKKIDGANGFLTTISSMGIKNGCSPLAWNPIQHSLCNRIQSDGIFENPMKSPKEKLKLLGGSEIIYIINSNNTIQKKDGTSWTRPDWVGLAHEMFHSYHQLKHSYSFQSEKEEDQTVNDTDLLIQEKIDAKIDINLTLRGTY